MSFGDGSFGMLTTCEAEVIIYFEGSKLSGAKIPPDSDH